MADGNQNERIARPQRERKAPNWYHSRKDQLNACAEEEGDPKTYEEALTSKKADHWKHAVAEELAQLQRMNTYKQAGPKDKATMTSRFVFKSKKDATGRVVKYKARLVARGFSQREGEDYDQVFAPVLGMESFRLIVSIAVNKGWFLETMDVTGAYLYGKLDTPILMQPPAGIEGCWVLDKALYGMKQAGRIWHKHILKVLQDFGLQQTGEDTIFVGKGLIVGIYVDDIVVAASDITDFMKHLVKCWI